MDTRINDRCDTAADTPPQSALEASSQIRGDVRFCLSTISIYRAQAVHRQHFDPTRCSSPPCCPSRPVAAPKTAGYWPAVCAPSHQRRESGHAVCRRGGRGGERGKKQRPQPGSAWARRGAWPKQRDLDKVIAMIGARARTGHGDLRHAGHAQSGAGRAAEKPPASITTTTTSIPRRNSYGDIVSNPHPGRPASTRWSVCAMPGFMSVAAALSAWANRAAAAPR